MIVEKMSFPDFVKLHEDFDNNFGKTEEGKKKVNNLINISLKLE